MNFTKNILNCTTWLIVISLSVSIVLGSERLYVFYPSTVDFQSMQKRMADALPGVNTTVFSRYDEFASKIKAESPEAIITKPILIREQFNDYEVILNGERNGITEGSFVLLSIDTNFTVKSITSETSIGVVDFLGRAGMKMFVKNYFPIEPKLKRVSRVGDLLPFLTLDVASGIMIEKVFIDYFKSTSKLQFVEIPLPESNAGVISFAIKKGNVADKALNSLKQNKISICELFYIQRWK